jgi:DNA-binding Lrp family transcriptional regulator
MDAATGFSESNSAGLKLELLNDWQRNFPLSEEPFAVIARQYGVSTETVLASYRQLERDGAVSRIGGVWAAGAGGAALLCAMKVPLARLLQVAQQVSSHPGVNHNYEREHEFNLWFVVTGRHSSAVESAVVSLEQDTGIKALRLPMQRVYRIDLGFDLRRNLPATSECLVRRAAGDPARKVPVVCKADEELAALAEAGIPIIARPYDHWGQVLGQSHGYVVETLARWLEQGTLKRFGVVVRHHEIGFDQNAMTVFDVPDERVDACAALLAQQPGVTLCYRRARAASWPYNLYCMVHGRARAEVEAQIAMARQASGLAPYPHAVLFSRQRFKQAGARYFRPASPEAVHVAR